MKIWASAASLFLGLSALGDERGQELGQERVGNYGRKLAKPPRSAPSSPKNAADQRLIAQRYLVLRWVSPPGQASSTRAPPSRDGRAVLPDMAWDNPEKFQALQR